MISQTARSRKVLASVLAAALTVGTCVPAVALADTASTSTSATITKAEALNKINAYMTLGLSNLSEEEIADVLSCAELLSASDYANVDQLYFVYTAAKQSVDEVEDLEAQVSDLEQQLKEAENSKAAENAYKFGSLTISKVTATGGMGKATVTFTPSKTISGVKYQIAYRANGDKNWSTKATSKKTATIKNLTKDKTYQFKVRGALAIGGKTYYTDYSKVATARVLPKYKTGTYKVTEAMGLTVRTKATTSAGVVTALKYNTKVKVKKVLVGSDKNIWGKVKVSGKTGYVQMQYLKKV